MIKREILFCVRGAEGCLLPIISSEKSKNGYLYTFVDEPKHADVLIVDVRGSASPAEDAVRLASEKRDSADYIVVCDSADSIISIEGICDIWSGAMSENELRFRFRAAAARREAYMQSRQNEIYLDTLIDNIPSMVWFKSRDGVHEKVNKEFCRVVNKERSDVVGKLHAYIWGVEGDDPACIDSDNRAMEDKGTVTSEEHVASEKGERVLTAYKTALRDIDGTVMGTVGFALDITKERAFESDILSKNKMFESMFASVDCGMMWHSINGKEVYYINKTALRILGYETADELMAKGFNYIADSVSESDKKMLADKIKTLKNPDDSVNVEYSVTHADGKVVHVLGNIKLRYEGGRYFYQRYLLDITARHNETLERERMSNELLSVLAADYSVVCYFDLNTGEGNTVYSRGLKGSSLESIFTEKLNFDEAIGKYCDERVSENDRERFLQNCSRVTLKKELSEKSSHFINYLSTGCENEGAQYYQIKAVRVGSNKSKIDFVLGIRSVDEELRSEMEHKEALESALEQANRANKAKSVFLSNMSHDIRTPMNAIMGFTTLALTHIDERDHVEGYLKKITVSGNHLLNLINDVLDMSRIESGKMRLEEKPCSLPEILHGLCNMMRPEIQKKQIDFRLDTANVRSEEIMCDRLHLNQVLLNLLSNAVKYTQPNGRVSLRTAETDCKTEGCSQFEFVVSDNGMGMSEEFVKHLFEPFERERNTTASGIQGTGLGMTITKNIVDMMGGTINVDSAPGEGTTITLKFEFKTLKRLTTEHIELAEYRGRHALVVDDDFNTCDSVTAMLGELGMRAEWTLSGKEAILRTKQAVQRGDCYAAYIIDCFLPDLNGIEVVRRIRRETGDNVPVIVLTAYDWTDYEDEAREAGVSAFCSKPMFMSELKNCLENVSRTESPEASDKKKLRAGRILLTEDNELNREIAATLLTEAGFEVELAFNGQEALEMVSASAPGYYGVVLMDVQMPVMNGYEATKRIRNLPDEELRKIPILAMTANAFDEDKREAEEAGMDGHLSKPIEIDKLFEALDNILRGK